MSPQPRGEIPPAKLRRLLAAKAAVEASEAETERVREEYRQAVADALKAGGSVRVVEEHTRLSMQTISDWGHARGWPTEKQKQRRRELYVRTDGEDPNHPTTRIEPA